MNILFPSWKSSIGYRKEKTVRLQILVFHCLFHLAPYFPTVTNFSSPPLKQKYIISNETFINLSFAIVVYKVEKSKHEMDIAKLPRLFIEFITGSFFKILQKDFKPEKKVLCLL